MMRQKNSLLLEWKCSIALFSCSCLLGCATSNRSTIYYARVDTEVTIDNKPIREARLYRSIEGTYVLKLNVPMPCDLYMIFPRLSQVAVTSPKYFEFNDNGAFLKKDLVAGALGVSPFEDNPRIDYSYRGFSFDSVGKRTQRISIKLQHKIPE